MTPIVAEFAGPFGLASRAHPLLFEQPIAARPGIYLWTIPFQPGGYLVSYIGETSASFGRRMMDHVIQTMGGNYRICDADLLPMGQVEVLWNGLWRPGTRDKMLEYLAQAEHLAPLARRELELTLVFAAHHWSFLVVSDAGSKALWPITSRVKSHLHLHYFLATFAIIGATSRSRPFGSRSVVDKSSTDFRLRWKREAA